MTEPRLRQQIYESPACARKVFALFRLIYLYKLLTSCEIKTTGGGIVIGCGGIPIQMDTLDQIFGLLDKERRRYVLYFLDQQDGPVSVEQVAEKVAEWETNGASVSIPEEKFEQVELDLLHTDLPKASEANYIRYDSEKGIVELTEAPPEFDAIISIAEVVERPDRNP